MKKVFPFILCICCLFAVTFTSCQEVASEKEQNFVDCYNKYVKSTLENPDTVVIKRVRETVDANGGTLVHFTYEYTTDTGYKTSRSLYMVTSKITIDPSLMTLSELQESLYDDEIIKFNGKSVDKGLVTESIMLYSQDENMQILSLWQSCQSDYSRSTTYDIDIINGLISK